jgi:hypothetical protein
MLLTVQLVRHTCVYDDSVFLCVAMLCMVTMQSTATLLVHSDCVLIA